MHPRLSSVVITGASTGIGAACALHLAARGVHVLAGVRNEADGEALRAHSNSAITPVRIDVTDRDCIAAAADFMQSRIGAHGLSGLVNNAGIVVAGPLEALPLDALRRQFEVNVIGQLAVTQALLPLLRKARGRIVNIGSIAGRVPLPFVAPYAMSKSALAAMTAALRMEVAAWGIEVALIEPGAIATPIWRKSSAAVDDLKQAMQPDTWSLYAEQLARVRERVAEVEKHAIAADAVVNAVMHALTARHPRTRYLVGTDAKIRAGLAAILPQRTQEALQRWFFGMPRRL